MARLTRWGTLVAVLAVCVCAALGAKSLAGVAWNSVVDYKSQYTALGVPAAAHGSAEASRTVLVIIDGLRVDASRKMGTLNSLRSYGSDLVLKTPQPSLSYPNWTTLLSGAPPAVSGVVTNWHEGKAGAETIFDTAKEAGVQSVFVGPEDFEALYGIKAKTSNSFMRKWDEAYLTETYVDEAIKRAALQPTLLVIHLPDVDEAGHAFGGASKQYADTVARVDTDLNRLVHELSDGHTVFVITADHGHIDTGGHGGWEPVVTSVPCVVSGPGVMIGKGTANQVDVASSVAMLAGIGAPRMTTGTPLEAVITSGSAEALRDAQSARDEFDLAAAQKIAAAIGQPVSATAGPGERRSAALDTMLAFERSARLPFAVLGAMFCVVAVLAIGFASWRALAAAAAGGAAYYAVFLGLYLGVHGYKFSLSAFNSEDKISAWMNGRLVEAAIATVVAVLVASIVYPMLRRSPKPARGDYLAGWLTLGPATALVILATLGLQVAWFWWGWGVQPVWDLPNLAWGFKFDIDLLQATAVGLVAVVTPLVSFVVGRYHPKVRTPAR
ncbi:MAG TPA: alkaline phosphatase family protein [Coriobacteriia bacterium]|nr:alkaline phosphatase family protein [Coriobacteriia bacterium]